ncbi:MAG: four helix bundle protein [Calditrichaeota bacterium]|nr:four helix bundle protein [Calditrichota bacterium]
MSRNIRNYDVFKLSHEMVLKIYEVTKSFPKEERYGLTSQLRRAAYSIPMNLIEGGAKNSEGEFRRFVDIAVGSCAEVEYQLELCFDLKYLSESLFRPLGANYSSIGKMLNRLYQKLR